MPGRVRRNTAVANAAEKAPFVGKELLLARMLMTLVDDAIKFSSAGSTVRLHLSTMPMRASTAESAFALYQIHVADKGPGVDAALHLTFFDRVVRGYRSRGVTNPTGSAGAGLGLAIACWIANAHGGEVCLDDGDVHGAVFVVELSAPRPDLN